MFNAKLSVIRWKWSSDEQLKMEKMLIVNKKYFVVEVTDYKYLVGFLLLFATQL